MLYPVPRIFVISLFLFSIGGSGPAVGQETASEIAQRHVKRGGASLQKGDLRGACFEFEAAKRVLSNWWVPHQEYVRCARLLGTPADELLRSLEPILAVDDRRPSLFFLQGNLYEDLDQIDRALGSYERAIALAPWMAEATLRIGALSFKRGDWERAQTAYTSALKAFPTDPLIRNQLALAFERKGQYREALEHLHALLDRSHYRKGVLARLARAYHALGMTAEYQRVMGKLSPRTP